MKASVLRFAVVGGLFVFVPWISIAVLALGQDVWLPWLQGDSWLAALGFVAAMGILCGSAVLGTQAASVTAGYAMGFRDGAPLALIGTGLAGWIGYLIYSRCGPRWNAMLADQPRMRALGHAVTRADAKNTFVLVALMRLAPLVPFGATNLLMAAHRARRWPFVIGTVVGFAPVALVMTRAGSALAEFRLGQPPPVSLWVYLGFLLVAVLGLGRAAARVLRRFE